jgi:hypothetical protein
VDTLMRLLVVGFMDATHSLIELLVRLMLVFTGLTLLIYLIPVDKNNSSASLLLQILT